jgi:hypothetical protein
VIRFADAAEFESVFKNQALSASLTLEARSFMENGF